MADIKVLIDVVGEQDMVKAVNTASRMELEYKKLDRQFNKSKLTAQQYAKGVQQLDAKYDALIATTKQLTTVTKQAGAAQQVVGKGANRAGVLAQQAGYQFGDFAVQVQSGTNVMVAAGQQATQLVGTFSMLAKTTRGIMAFSALGVIIPVITGIAAAFMRTKEAADDSSLAVKAFEERLKTAKEETVEMAEKLRFLQSGFGTESEFALHEDFAAASAELERLESQLASAKGPDTYFESEANKLAYIGILEDSIVLQGQEKDLAEAALKTYLETLAALELEEFQRQENLRLQEEAEAAAERYQTLVDRTNANYEDQLALALAINALGEDHADVARLRFEQEGKRMGLLGAELIMYASQQMVLRGIVLDTEAKAEALERSQSAAYSIGAVSFSNLADGATWAGSLADQLERARAASLTAAVGGNVDFFDTRGPEFGSRLSGVIPEERGVPRENRAGYKPPSSRGGGGGSDPFDQDAYLESLQEEANFKRRLVGLGEAEITELERRREIVEKMTADGQTLNAADEERIKNILATEAATRRAIAAEEQRQATFDMVSGHIETAFMSMVDGSKSVEDAFKGMLRNILIEVYKQAIVKPMVGGIMSFLGFKDGGAFSGGNVIPFANGGVVSSATMFPMAGNQTGVMGEAGPEAIMPLKRGANGKLGVQVQGGGENVVIHQNFNFQANGDDSVKRIIAQAAPQIANMTKKSMMDDRRRGGQMKTTFG
jgi:hypothetical protein